MPPPSSPRTGTVAPGIYEPPILDTWAPLSHKKGLLDMAGGQGFAATWVGTHARRLNAYTILAGYLRNVARSWLPDTDIDRRDQHREYGDAETIVAAIRAAILGDRFALAVDGAGDEDPPEPTEADVVDGGPSLDELRAEWETERARLDAARERQEWLDTWADQERATLKVIETENHAVGLGDGVYLVVNGDQQRRPLLRSFDPGFYFPDEDDSDDEFPRRVHLAWEWERDDGQVMVRRRTWELVTVAEAAALDLDDDELADAEDLETERVYPYDDEPSRWVCLYTDADWRLDTIRDATVRNLPLDEAEFRVDDTGAICDQLDLGIDFIPLVHVPNTVNLAEGWGQSSLSRIVQILDDIAAADTDIAAAAALVGGPTIAVEGTPANTTSSSESYGPGQILWGGKMTALDLSSGLEALLKLSDALAERLSVNRQLPGSVLGRIEANSEGVESGIHRLLSFGPFRAMIEEARLVREGKYRLLLKMVQRLAIVGGWLGESEGGGTAPARARGEVLEARIEFGSYLPTDLAQLKDLVLALIEAHLLSRATGLRILRDAGLDVTDLDEEIAAANAENFQAAGELADAVGDETEARRFLRLAPGEGDEPPDPDDVLPPPG